MITRIAIETPMMERINPALAWLHMLSPPLDRMANMMPRIPSTSAIQPQQHVTRDRIPMTSEVIAIPFFSSDCF